VKERALTNFRRFTAILVSLLLSPLPALCEPQGAGQHAGQINAMVPAATRNTQTAKPNDELQWSDLLKTEHSGRVRAGLTDGSILSLGSDSELRIVQHDATSQQTSLELNYGKVRSQVQKITQPGGKYEMKTPNAVIGVIGTDFYVGYEANKTTVICYEGQLSVTPTGNAQVQNNTGQASAAGNSIVVAAGQMVEITSEIPPAGFHAAQVPPSAAQNGILSTNVPDKELHPVRPEHNPGRWVALGYAVGVGLALGITMGTGNGGRPAPAKGCKINPQTGLCS
jgi:ferric-dicitrate binding protein FerR (iron transport regulator)